MALLGLLILAGTGLELLGPQVLQWAIDAALSGTTSSYLGRLGLLYMATILMVRAVQAGTAYLAADLGWRATNRLRGDLARHVLALPLHFHAELTPGRLAERIDGDVGALGGLLSSFVLRLLANGVLLIGAIVVLFAKDWRVGLIFLASLAVTVLVYRRLGSVAVPASRAERQAQSELMGVLEEDLAGAADARPLGAEPYLLRRLYRAAREHVLASRLAWPLGAVPFAATLLIMGLNEALGLAVGVRLVETGVLTLGTVYLIAQYNELVGQPLRELSRQLGQLQAAGASVQRVEALLAHPPERDAEEEGGPVLPPGPLGVRFRDVDLAYPGGPPVLRGLSFALAPGRCLGVVGRTGGGKSSLARLLLRLYEPTGGSTLIGAGDEWHDIRQVPLAELRRRVGLVTQEVQLFPASVRDNLTLFGALAADDDRLTWALEEVGLGAWLRRLPRGLDTLVLSGEGGLSAGEAQLLALARVFLRDPGLVLLDEASSRLDPSSEALLQRAVDRLLAGRTAIVIAHRLSTLDRTDEVLVIEAGQAREHGPREALAADPGSRFHRLLQVGLDGSDGASGSEE
jgi:ATP-binding cassette subfamily B protein